MKSLLQTTLEKDIKLETDFADDNWYCFLDSLQLESAILNMTINARDAMPEGGTLKFSIREVSLSQAEASRRDLQVGDFLKLSVQDSGVGMSEESKRQAFDPFYTTKQNMGGSGLGLSTVFGFIRQSGGHLFFEPSEVGTTISMLLPRGAAPSSLEEPSISEAIRLERNKTVLLVGDNVGVRLLVSELLKSLGFQVVEVASVVEADVFEETPFDLLVCDLMMPGNRKGPDIARKFREQQQDLKVLFMSGYQEGVLTAEDLQSDHASFIQKHFSRNDSAAQIVKLLQVS
ncbi:MAG: CheY-like chemotaxis protein [Candidatus Azotimanducaceae bacterium]|jgi:CheY-like chemotaxis protein